jgi:XRE family aerobic/anaerobic benzoate catabolism transcriptional regulator
MARVMQQGDMRPMAHSPRAMKDLNAILDSRTPLYAKAEIAITTTGKTPDAAAAELLRAVTLPDNRIARRSA